MTGYQKVDLAELLAAFWAGGKRIDTAGPTQYLTLRITWWPVQQPGEEVTMMATPLRDYSTKPGDEEIEQEPVTTEDKGQLPR